jgi:CBS domain-containing protein
MDVARTDVVTADYEATLEEVARTLTDRRVGSVVVVDGDGPVGIITDRDLVTYGMAMDRDPGRAIANDILSPSPVTASVEDSVFDVIRLMGDEGVRRIPIVDGDELAGIVTLDDFVALLATELGRLASVIESESPP